MVGGIIFFTLFTFASFFLLPLKYSISFAIMDFAVIVFAILIWWNDKYYNEQMGLRVFSISDKKFIRDVIFRQMNMHGVSKILEKDNIIEFYKGKEKAGEVRFKLDENGKPLIVDGKYVIELEAPEYILHNIDHELWSLIGHKQ
ncbi:MAG TPA: hypothetical protein EYH43_03180 [Persephonella sp.]|nr:hypothetical protein [Hydrogenothermaceae bacterium]HIQ24965.1 hypothetical protein [Persephonella sp.]